MNAFRTPAEWQEELGIRVLDPDGWRRDAHLGPKSWDIPIPEWEFRERAFQSTCMSEGAWPL